MCRARLVNQKRTRMPRGWSGMLKSDQLNVGSAGCDLMIVNIYEAKARLSALLEKAQAGEEVVIARAGKPVVRLAPIAPATQTRSGIRFGGLKATTLKLSADFHAPLSDDDLLGW